MQNNTNMNIPPPHHHHQQHNQREQLHIITTAAPPSAAEQATVLNNLGIQHLQDGSYEDAFRLFCQGMSIVKNALKSCELRQQQQKKQNTECNSNNNNNNSNGQGDCDDGDSESSRISSSREKSQQQQVQQQEDLQHEPPAPILFLHHSDCGGSNSSNKEDDGAYVCTAPLFLPAPHDSSSSSSSDTTAKGRRGAAATATTAAATTPPVVVTLQHYIRLSFVYLYNLALTHHLAYVHDVPFLLVATNHPKASTSSTEHLIKALTLYELAVSVQSAEQDSFHVTALQSMAILNNLGMVHKVLGNHDRAQDCFENLLATILYYQNYEQEQDGGTMDHDDHSTEGGYSDYYYYNEGDSACPGGRASQRDVLDGFLGNVVPLILRSKSASAA
jgi:tetratricopeptide (TPR) repeat protein